MIKDFICLMCPNGCHLVNEALPDGSLKVDGNRCPKGLAFARSVFAAESKIVPRMVSGQARPSYPDSILQDIIGLWDIPFKKTLPGLMPAGSPERTEFRVVIEDALAQRFVLEEIPPAAFHTKMKIVKTLDLLVQKGMPYVTPYKTGKDGQHIQKYADGLWQLVPFSPGVPLDRETYLYEGWRAEALSRFVIELKRRSQGVAFFEFDEVFSIKKYIYKLSAQIRAKQPRVMAELQKTIDFLEKDFMKAHDLLPVSFAHGDFHPLNIIWKKDGVEAVIDWEFLGMKPEIYDVANMIGCLGMEHPSSLTDELVVNFVRQLCRTQVISPISWEYLVEFMVAMRFAWLSEWLRKDDSEMIALELEYMDLLVSHRDQLRQEWL